MLQSARRISIQAYVLRSDGLRRPSHRIEARVRTSTLPSNALVDPTRARSRDASGRVLARSARGLERRKERTCESEGLRRRMRDDGRDAEKRNDEDGIPMAVELRILVVVRLEVFRDAGLPSFMSQIPSDRLRWKATRFVACRKVRHRVLRLFPSPCRRLRSPRILSNNLASKDSRNAFLRARVQA